MINDSFYFPNIFICDSKDNSILNRNYIIFNHNLNISEDSIDEESILYIKKNDRNIGNENKDNKNNSVPEFNKFQKNKCEDTATTSDKTKNNINNNQSNEKNKSEKNVLSKETKQSIKPEKKFNKH